MSKAEKQLISDAEALEKESRFEDAIKIYSTLINRNVGGWYTLDKRAAAHFRQRGWDETIADYTALIALHPRQIAFWINRSTAYRRKKEYAKALSDLEAATKLNPTNTVALRLKADTLLDLDELDKAEATIEYLFAHSSKTWAEPHILKSILCFKRYQTACLISESRKALDLKPNDASANNNLAYGLLLFERPQESFMYLDKAHEASPQWAFPINNRGLAYLMLRRWDEAAESIERALSNDPGLAEAYDNKGLLLLETGRLDEAKVEFDKALLLKPTLAAALRNRGKTYFLKKDSTLAIADLNRSIEINPNSAQSFEVRALILTALGEKNQAQSDQAAAKRIRLTYNF